MIVVIYADIKINMTVINIKFFFIISYHFVIITNKLGKISQLICYSIYLAVFILEGIFSPHQNAPSWHSRCSNSIMRIIDSLICCISQIIYKNICCQIFSNLIIQIPIHN